MNTKVSRKGVKHFAMAMKTKCLQSENIVKRITEHVAHTGIEDI